MDKENELEKLPEILEYLKQARTLIRQMQLLKKVSFPEDDKIKLKKATEKIREEANCFLNKLEKEE